MDSGITPLPPQQEVANEEKATHEGYLHRVVEEIDVTANVIAGGHQDETISSRVGRDAEQGHIVGKVVTHGLDLFQHNHSATAQAADKERAEEIIKLEDSDGILPNK